MVFFVSTNLPNGIGFNDFLTNCGFPFESTCVAGLLVTVLSRWFVVVVVVVVVDVVPSLRSQLCPYLLLAASDLCLR